MREVFTFCLPIVCKSSNREELSMGFFLDFGESESVEDDCVSEEQEDAHYAYFVEPPSIGFTVDLGPIESSTVESKELSWLYLYLVSLRGAYEGLDAEFSEEELQFLIFNPRDYQDIILGVLNESD